MSEKRITIDPITRLEGHGKIEIFLDDEGNVENALLQVSELRGFEEFCKGRPAEEMPRITARICGVCPLAHHFASVKALDMAFNVEPPEPAKKLRELMYSGYFIYDHILHFYALGGPDFVVGPDAPKEERNILGVINKVGLKVGKDVIKHRAYGQRVIEILGGKATHPVSALPGGLSKGLSEEERAEIERMAESCVQFSKFSLKLFDDIVLKNKEYLEAILSDAYRMETYYMGLVDKADKVNFYDGKIKVVDPDGREFAKVDAKDYLSLIEEHVEPWSYAKFPYLKKVGWRGFVDGKESGVFRVAPLARLNVANGMATPLADDEYKKMYETLGRPAHATLANHWARLIELLYASEHLLELSRDDEITSENIRNLPNEPGEGIGVIEAARGTLIHHYKLDEKGLIKSANLVVATVNNNAAMSISVKKAAEQYIKNWNVSDGLLNRVEMAFRAYDPCLSCATHSLPGEMPLIANIYNKKGELYRQVRQNI